MHPLQSSRIDVQALKAEIVKKVGPDKSKQYFYHLNRLLSDQLSKSEFNKICFRVLGRENVPLHNQLIRSILKNAYQAKTPPPICEAGAPPKSAIQIAKSTPRNVDEHEQDGSKVPSQHQKNLFLSNGVLPAPPKRCRTGHRGKLKDRPSPLGPNGKLGCALHQSTDKAIMENGVPCDYQRPLCDRQAVAEQPDNGAEGLAQPAKRMKVDGRDQNTLAPVDDGEEAERLNHLKFSSSPLLAPLGIPYCSASVGGSRKTTPVGNTGAFMSYNRSRELYDTETLRQRMEQIAVAQGLGGVSPDCAAMLNKMLDVYLMRLIKPCVELVGATRAPDPNHQPFNKQQVQNKVINGMRPRNHMHMQGGSGSMHTLQEQRPQRSISMLDLKVAMELNPQQLGEDWPLQLEKINMRSFEQ